MKALRVALVAGTLAALLVPVGPLAAAKLKPADLEAEKAAFVDAAKNFGFNALRDWDKVWPFVLTLVGAAVVGGVIAYHPFAGKRGNLDDVDEPKIIITYTVVGALIAHVVALVPPMALVIFGIGGLMRFRTDVGLAKATGRTILATILGLACGLELWMVAILGTAIAWILIWMLERWKGMRMTVRGLQKETLAQSAEAYGTALSGLKCSFSTPGKNPAKGQLSFVLRARRGLDREDIEAAAEKTVPKELKGTIDWPEE